LLLDGREVARKIATYRTTTRAIKTYYMPILELAVNDFIHPGLNQLTAITGRFSCKKPNLQNQPRPGEGVLGKIRECYIPRSPNRSLVSIDYDQIEVRLTAHFSRQEHMITAINNNEDLHGITTTKLFGIDKTSDNWSLMRYLGKRLNFATIYGSGGKTFSNSVLEDTKGKVRLTEDQANEYIHKWWEIHDKVREFAYMLINEAALYGGIFTHGRRYIKAPSRDYVLLNYFIQGSAADVIKQAMIKVFKLLKPYGNRALMVLQIHDELLFDIEDDLLDELIPKLVHTMEDRTSFSVPLTVSVGKGKNWLDAK
jgi:DNA polymerase-1